MFRRSLVGEGPRAMRRNMAAWLNRRQASSRPSKVLILGPGGLSIGQPSSLDMFGVQAIRALKEEQIRTVLLNPNIATMQTDETLADTVYFLPITPDYVQHVVERERPDSVLFTFGGRTALHCGLEAARQGVFETHGVRILGSPFENLAKTVYRDTLFHHLNEIRIPLADAVIVHSLDEALEAARRIGYPVAVRQLYTLGHWSSEFAQNETSLRGILAKAFLVESRWLIEKSMEHWKSVEIELLRDGADTCLPVCHMESLDPIGIHPGNSIMIAPSQTLTATQIERVEEAAIEIARHLDLRGACNIHFAVEPGSDRFRVVGVNPRISRTTGLASKASGLMCSYVAAKIALHENEKYLKPFAETLRKQKRDYLVCRVPRFDLTKFHLARRELGSAVKSVGEASAVGKTFAEALQKAIRMVNPEFLGFDSYTFGNVQGELRNPTDQRLFAIVHALINRRYTPEQVHAYTGIDMWFLKRLVTLGNVENRLREHEMKTVPEELLAKAKRAGFSDRQIATFLDADEMDIRRLRIGLSILPTMIERPIAIASGDLSRSSTAADAGLSFRYATYHGNDDEQHQQPPTTAATSSSDSDEGRADERLPRLSTMVLGSGVHRIGSSVEYDWCTSNCIETLHQLGHASLLVSYHPELVVSHEARSHRFYFEELTLERVLDIFELERPSGVVVSVGGQMPLNMSLDLDRQGVPILGTTAQQIDVAENRQHFCARMDELGVAQPPWRHVTRVAEATQFAADLGYPVLVRPSYVLAGTAFNLASDRHELEKYIMYALDASRGNPVVLTQFVEDAREIDVDGVAQQGRLVVHAVAEKIENAGIHSGDSTLVLPSRELPRPLLDEIRELTERITQGLHISGPFNLQLAHRMDRGLLVLGCNLRASRSFPFVSKALDVNFIDLATRAMCGAHVVTRDLMGLSFPYECVKMPQFSFARVTGADPFLNVEMTSTSEVACFGESRYPAYLEGIQALYGFRLRGKTILLSSDEKTDLRDVLKILQKFHRLGYTLYGDARVISVVAAVDPSITVRNWEEELLIATPPSCVSANTTEEGSSVAAVPDTTTNHSGMATTTATMDLALRPGVDLVVSLGRAKSLSYQDRNYVLRRQAIDFGIPLIHDSKCALLLATALEQVDSQKVAPIKSWKDYVDDKP